MNKLALISGVGILLGTGIVHGLWTDRWTTSVEPEAIAAKLARVPETIGEWHSHPLEIGPREREIASIAEYVGRVYINSRTKSRVQVFLVCGRPGPISVHTPDVCFEGAGFRMTAEPAKYTLEFSPPDEFWQVTFLRDNPDGQDRVRVFWAWNSDGHWKAPENPRWTFARFKALYKLYVIHDLPRPGFPIEKDPSLDLLRVLLPELQK
jgi:hypothetical protein